MRKTIPDKEIQEYMSLYESGLSYEQVGQKFGKKGFLIYAALKNRGLLRSRSIEEYRRKLSDQETKNIIELYESGLTYKQISEKTGRSDGTIAVALTINRTENNTPESTQESQEYLKLYKSGLSYSQIGERFGRSGNSIYFMLLKHGLLNSRGLHELVRNKTPDQKVQEYYEAYASGMKWVDIGEKFGRHYSTILRVLKSNGLLHDQKPKNWLQ